MIDTSPQMRLPMQAAPVARLAGPAALANGSGMEASGWFDDIVGTVKSLAPVAQAAAPLLAGLI